jgi:hypothetical protein
MFKFVAADFGECIFLSAGNRSGPNGWVHGNRGE